MAVVGYARVSSTGQSLDVQLSKLTEAGCERIYKEKRSGLDGARPELADCLKYLREGDIFVITRLDRLARSTLHLHTIVNELREKGVYFRVLEQAIDTSTPTGRLMFALLASIAEFETELRKERQMEGIRKAKSDGVRFGRERKLTDAEVKELRIKRLSGVLIRDLMDEYGLGKTTVYRLLGTSNAGESAGPTPVSEVVRLQIPGLDSTKEVQCPQ